MRGRNEWRGDSAAAGGIAKQGGNTWRWALSMIFGFALRLLSPGRAVSVVRRSQAGSGGNGANFVGRNSVDLCE